MTKKTNTHGGQRENAGRKTVTDKKVNVAIYTPQSRVDTLGAEQVKTLAVAAIERAYKKALKS